MCSFLKACCASSFLVLAACSGGGSDSTVVNPTPPAISGLQFSPGSTILDAGGGTIDISASLSFADAGGDLASLTLTTFDASNAQVGTAVAKISGASGITSGPLAGPVRVSTATAGQYTFQVYVTDLGGAKSNTLSGTFQVGYAGIFAPTGNQNFTRGICATTLLANGKVLMCGGTDNGSLASNGGSLVYQGDVYDPATGIWTPTPGGMGTDYARAVNFATLLPSGMVLIAGGVDIDNVALATAELYDPITNTFSVTGSMTSARANHGAVLLKSGKVLMVGGRDATGAWVNTAEFYDPATATWSATGSMGTARGGHSLFLLPDGRVLVAGGITNPSDTATATAEIYDPGTGRFTPTASLNDARAYALATTLADGKPILAGGWSAGFNLLSGIEVYDPVAGTWARATSMATARYLGAAVPLRSGKVLLTGGRDGSGNPMASAELYDPATGLCAGTASMTKARVLNGRSVLLPSGKVLIAGSGDGTAELYQ